MYERDVDVLRNAERQMIHAEVAASLRYLAALARMRVADAALWAVTRPGGCDEVEEWHAAGSEYVDAADAVESYAAFPVERWWS